MNYNSVQDIINTGITNMTVLINNVAYDDNAFQITAIPSWIKFNNVVSTSMYASGNTWIGITGSAEQLKVNRRDAKMYYLYSEEGTLYNYYRFFKIRWKGFSTYSGTSDSYALEYDVIFWDTGDISLHMVKIPTSSYNGSFQLAASTTISYTAPTVDSPDVTFFTQDENNTVYTASNELITMECPFERRWLIRANGAVYTIQSDELVEITADELTAEVFLQNGLSELPELDHIFGLIDPEILYWQDSEYEPPVLEATLTATPYPQSIITENIDLTHHTIVGIASVTGECEGSPLFACEFNGTWKEFNGTSWVDESSGMTFETLQAITSEQWDEAIADLDFFRIKFILGSGNDVVTKIVVNFNTDVSQYQ